jgi:L-ascorbate metabolism protein UlaG (beta-lactamase superfamily)
MPSDPGTPARDHFDGRRYFNPTGANGLPFRAVPRMLREPRRPWPRHVAVEPRRPPVPAAGEIVVTFIGQATFLIQTPDGNILTDPVWSTRASPIPFAGPRRVRAPGVAIADLPGIDVILLSHNHYDHCDTRTLRALARRFGQPLAVTPLGNRTILQKAGFRRITELDWWGTTTAGALAVTLVPAQHFSGRGPFDRNRALWGGFHVVTRGHSVLFAGDTGYGPHFQAMRARLGPPDLALLPIGAYEPRWFMKDIHLNPAEAVQAHRDLEARQSVGMHFGTFQLTPEAIDDPVIALAEALRAQGLPGDRFRTLEAGASLQLPLNGRP